MSAKKQSIKSDESLDVYFHEIGEKDLLTAEEEKVLAQRISEGDERAVDRMVEANLRFVVSIAKKYQNRGLSLSDLISEGNIGLMTAVRRFDGSMGLKFISYAVWWIRQAILSALANQSRLIRLPTNKVDELKKIRQRNEQREQMMGKGEERADEIEPPQSMPEWASTPISLDAPLGGYNDLSLMDFIEDQNNISPDDELMRVALKQEIKLVLASLTPRENEVLNLYFGLDSNRPYTLEAIGSRFGLTRERIRQIKQKAINKIRHTSRGYRLASFAE